MSPSGSDIVWRQIHWPLPLDVGLAVGLMRRLAASTTRTPIIWETRSIEGRVSHVFGAAAHAIRVVDEAVTSQVPSTTTSPAVGADQVDRVARLKLRGQQFHLAVDKTEHAARAVLGALAQAHFKGERVLIQAVLYAGADPVSTPKRIPDPTQSWLSSLVFGERPATAELRASIRDKRSQHVFNATLRVAVAAASPGRQETLLRSVLDGLRVVQSPGTLFELSSDRSTSLTDAPSLHHRPIILTSAEIVALLGWPVGAEDLPGMPAPHPRLLAVPRKLQKSNRTFATSNAPGADTALGIPISDALSHTLAIGPTGSGKSTVFLSLITADIAAGRSVVVVDPKADLVADVLARIPVNCRDRVVVLDPTDEKPVGLNPLTATAIGSELVADSILGIFRELFPSAFGPRTSDILHASLLTLARTNGATLTWLPRLLTDARLRARLVGAVSDDAELAHFWAQYSAMSERQQLQHIGPVLSRLRQFLLRPSLRRVLEQATPRFELGSIFTTPTILLVPLNTGLLGNDAARLLGSLLVSKLWQLTLGRAALPSDQRPPVSIYVDEAQEFLRLGGDLSDALARSRSLGVAWHIAHQYRDQLPPEMRSALDANARNKIVFGLSAKDARDFAAMAPTLTAEDFMALPQFAVYANLMNGGQQTGWMSGVTKPPPPVISDAADLRRLSRQNFGGTETSDMSGSEPSGAPPGPPTSAPTGRRPRTAK
jgi:hypothetical protein